ncbi:zinc-dependent alcohol dehydrogenase family protein [Streptomyces prasinosporus]|uniref:Zinc-dependent alcohol dehydrogenase family protein n=1 Tax=Streptomyces prasinosporus TaxID=68256 RepID=A0ABP6THZ4_9ACTN
MRALVYHAPGQVSWDVVKDPGIEAATDALVRVDATAVSGCDLRVVRGDLPEVEPGTVLGHEAVGEVLEVGRAVRRPAVGDRVVVSSVSVCGHCAWCRSGWYGQCPVGGWLLGHRVDGTQAEIVRVPFAGHSLHRWPSSVTPEEAVLLSEVLPAAYELGVRAGGVGPGQTVVVVGAGPVGLAAAAVARVRSPLRVVAVDLSRPRLATAVRVGADAARLPGAAIAELAAGPGADVVIETTGTAEGFVLGTRMARRGGTVAVVAPHGGSAVLHPQTLWERNLTVRTGRVDTRSVPWLADLMRLGRLRAAPLVTGTRPLAGLPKAYEAFAHGAETGDLKLVALRRTGTAGRERPRIAHAAH